MLSYKIRPDIPLFSEQPNKEGEGKPIPFLGPGERLQWEEWLQLGIKRPSTENETKIIFIYKYRKQPKNLGLQKTDRWNQLYYQIMSSHKKKILFLAPLRACLVNFS